MIMTEDTDAYSLKALNRLKNSVSCAIIVQVCGTALTEYLSVRFYVFKNQIFWNKMIYCKITAL